MLPNNDTTINHDGLDDEVVPGAYAADVAGEGSEDVRACAVAAGDKKPAVDATTPNAGCSSALEAAVEGHR